MGRSHARPSSALSLNLGSSLELRWSLRFYPTCAEGLFAPDDVNNAALQSHTIQRNVRRVALRGDPAARFSLAVMRFRQLGIVRQGSHKAIGK